MFAQQAPNLKEIQLSAFIFNRLSGYDEAYRIAKESPLDLRVPQHAERILDFLGSWGCRHLAIKNRKYAIRSMVAWYLKYHLKINKLPKLERFKTEHYIFIMELFDDLSQRQVCSRNEKKTITMAPVATSKMLLLIREDVFAPWDNAIAHNLQLSMNGQGYIKYLQLIAIHIKNLKKEATRMKTTIDNKIKETGRNNVPLPKLIDEYYYLTFTRKLDITELIKIIKA